MRMLHFLFEFLSPSDRFSFLLGERKGTGEIEAARFQDVM